MTQRKLRIIARNVSAKLLLVTDFDFGDALNEKELGIMERELRSVAYSVVKKCYRSDKWLPKEIVNDVIKNVK